jgi:type I restriction enzyme M protein
MSADYPIDTETFKARHWKMADTLRANSNLASNEYFLPIMGLIFLRYATSRFDQAKAAIETDMKVGKMPNRPLIAADFQQRRAMMLPERAHFDALLRGCKDGSLGSTLTSAMEAVEAACPPLAGQLPKDYERFEDDVLEGMLRLFDGEWWRTASGDMFGRIYEYFLAEFSKQGAHDGGEFFTPPSIVWTIVNIIEPDHGIVFDPACGSGGMFVQTSHFTENAGQDTMKRVTFYGHEKNETTAKLARINLAVHALQGNIRAGNEAITYYNDPHKLAGKCDFVMANPPFNVDEVDAEKIKGDRRLPFGLPGVSKAKRVYNANYLWLSYSYSYLNENGRAGVVMSSPSSSAGRDEAVIRQKMVATGAVDVIIDIRGNFFFTRHAPCQLWFFDRAKERDAARRDHVLMLDARNIFRKVSRSICDFSPEQQKNIAAIVWLYRGRTDRFLALVVSYLAQAVRLGEAVGLILNFFDDALGELANLVALFAMVERTPDPLAEPWDELTAAQVVLAADIEAFRTEAAVQSKEWEKAGRQNAGLHAARAALHPLAQRCRNLTKQIDLASKLAGRVVDICVKDLAARNSDLWVNADISRACKALDDARARVVEALRKTRYFVQQADWLQDHFPDAALCDVNGLVKLIDRATIAAYDWSLAPGRYVGVVPEERDKDFDFEEALRAIHIDLSGLNEEATELAEQIARNFEELMV